MSRIRLASSSELQEGAGIRFPVSRGGRAVSAFAIRFQGQVRAWVNACTHRAVELDLGSGVFFHPSGQLLLCRAHGAMFHPVTGACAGGMCAKSSALEPVSVVEEEGAIWLVDGTTGVVPER